MSDAAEETEAEEAEGSNDEKAYGFWIYLMSDAINLRVAVRHLCGDHNTMDGPGGHTLFRLRTSSRKRRCWQAARLWFRQRTLGWVIVTFLLGLGFVAMKITEFYGMAAVAALELGRATIMAADFIMWRRSSRSLR